MLALDRENKENLLILEDETVVAAWVQNPYWQYFCGMRDFQWAVPCDPSDQIYFPQHIGEAGVHRILKVTVQSLNYVWLKPNSRPTLDEWDGPACLLLAQPAQRWPGAIIPKNFQQLFYAD